VLGAKFLNHVAMQMAKTPVTPLKILFLIACPRTAIEGSLRPLTRQDAPLGESSSSARLPLEVPSCTNLRPSEPTKRRRFLVSSFQNEVLGKLTQVNYSRGGPSVKPMKFHEKVVGLILLEWSSFPESVIAVK